MSHLLRQIPLTVSLPASSHLRCPISCGKFLFPSPCLPVPNSYGTCFLPTCQFRPWKSHSGLGSPMSCGQLLFPSPYLPVPALEVPCHVVNSSPLDVPSPAANSSYPPYLPVPTLHVPSPVVKFLFPSPCLPVPNSCGTCFLPTCQFRPWKSHSGLGSPMSCGKFLFPSPYLPVPALEVPCHVVNSSPLDVPSPAANSSYRLPTCQFPP